MIASLSVHAMRGDEGTGIVFFQLKAMSDRNPLTLPTVVRDGDLTGESGSPWHLNFVS